MNWETLTNCPQVSIYYKHTVSNQVLIDSYHELRNTDQLATSPSLLQTYCQQSSPYWQLSYNNTCTWAECNLLFSLVYQLCLALWYKSNTRMLVTFGICFKQHFDTRYLLFYNPSPPRMFLSLNLLWEYRIQHGANGPLYVTSNYSTWIFCRGISGFATDCPCGVWCRGLTTCLLHVGPPFENWILNNSWAVGLTLWIMNHIFLCFDIRNYICLDTSDNFSVLPS